MSVYILFEYIKECKSKAMEATKEGLREYKNRCCYDKGLGYTPKS